MSKIILATGRLILRELTLADADFILALYNTPAYLEFIGDKNIHSIEEARSHLKNDRINSYKTNGFGLWLVETKESNIPVGTCGLIKRAAFEDIDIGFAFLPKYFGKGYGFEAASATLNYAYKKLKLDKVIAYTNKDNKASIELLQKLGMKYEKDVAFLDNTTVKLFLGIKKPD